MDPLACTAYNQRFQHFANRPPQQFRASVPCDILRSPIPKCQPSLDASQGDALGKTIESAFEQFCSIGHPNPFTPYIGSGKANFIALRLQRRLEFSHGSGMSFSQQGVAR
jgi:hypothetical protein